jgi:hypothetical protein
MVDIVSRELVTPFSGYKIAFFHPDSDKTLLTMYPISGSQPLVPRSHDALILSSRRTRIATEKLDLCSNCSKPSLIRSNGGWGDSGLVKQKVALKDKKKKLRTQIHEKRNDTSRADENK